MARDDNDRPYDDGQGRPVNPDLTGDVLSPRWSTDDTDEQPAVPAKGNETYILPLDSGAPGDPYQSDSAYPEEYPESGAHADSTDPEVRAYSDSPDPEARTDSTDPGVQTYSDSAGPDARTHADGAYRTDPEIPAYEGNEPDGHREEPAYLPLDRGYAEPAEQPGGGFLGSGWTGADDDGEKETRRRTRLLLAAAAAVVVMGVGAGWMLTSTSADDPCAGGRCAGVGDLGTPEIQDGGEGEVPVEEPADTPTPESSATASETPTTPPTAQARVRPARTPTAEPEPEPEPEPTRTRTRAAEPDPEPSVRVTRAPVQETDEAELTDRPEPRKTEDDTPTAPPDDPVTEVPEPEETRRGLFDVLFPWR